MLLTHSWHSVSFKLVPPRPSVLQEHPFFHKQLWSVLFYFSTTSPFICVCFYRILHHSSEAPFHASPPFFLNFLLRVCCLLELLSVLKSCYSVSPFNYKSTNVTGFQENVIKRLVNKYFCFNVFGFPYKTIKEGFLISLITIQNINLKQKKS